MADHKHTDAEIQSSPGDPEAVAHREALDSAVGALIDNYVANVCNDHPDTGHGYIHLHAKNRNVDLRQAAADVYSWGTNPGNTPRAKVVRVSAMLDDIAADPPQKVPKAGMLVVAFVVTDDAAHSIEAHERIKALAADIVNKVPSTAPNQQHFGKEDHYCCWSDHP